MAPLLPFIARAFIAVGLAAAGLIEGAMAQPTNTASAANAGAPAALEIFRSRLGFASSRADAELVDAFLMEASNYRRAATSGTTGRTPESPGPSPAQGGFSTGRGLSWAIHTSPYAFVALHGVSEEIARRFNTEVFGEPWMISHHQPASVAGFKPFAGRPPEGGIWLVVSFQALDRFERLQQRPQPLAITESLIGLSIDQGLLEARGVFIPDALGMVSLLFGLTTVDPGLITDAYLSGQDLSMSVYRWLGNKERLIHLRDRCNAQSEFFAKKDCMSRLRAYLGVYGREFDAARYLLIPGTALTTWSEPRQGFVSEVRSLLLTDDAGLCMEKALCIRVGPYGVGQYRVCYRMDQTLNRNLFFAAPEPQAREISARLGSPAGLNEAGLLYEVTEPARFTASQQMCSRPGSADKVVALGRIKLAAQTLGSGGRVEVARTIPSSPAPVVEKAAPNREPAALSRVPSRPNAGRITIDAK